MIIKRLMILTLSLLPTFVRTMEDPTIDDQKSQLQKMHEDQEGRWQEALKLRQVADDSWLKEMREFIRPLDREAKIESMEPVYRGIGGNRMYRYACKDSDEQKYLFVILNTVSEQKTEEQRAIAQLAFKSQVEAMRAASGAGVGLVMNHYWGCRGNKQHIFSVQYPDNVIPFKDVKWEDEATYCAWGDLLRNMHSVIANDIPSDDVHSMFNRLPGFIASVKERGGDYPVAQPLYQLLDKVATFFKENKNRYCEWEKGQPLDHLVHADFQSLKVIPIGTDGKVEKLVVFDWEHSMSNKRPAMDWALLKLFYLPDDNAFANFWQVYTKGGKVAIPDFSFVEHLAALFFGTAYLHYNVGAAVEAFPEYMKQSPRVLGRIVQSCIKDGFPVGDRGKERAAFALALLLKGAKETGLV